MKLAEMFIQMVSKGADISSKRVGGLFLILIFGIGVVIMVVQGDYSFVALSGKLGVGLVAGGLLECVLRRK